MLTVKDVQSGALRGADEAANSALQSQRDAKLKQLLQGRDQEHAAQQLAVRQAEEQAQAQQAAELRRELQGQQLRHEDQRLATQGQMAQANDMRDQAFRAAEAQKQRDFMASQQGDRLRMLLGKEPKMGAEEKKRESLLKENELRAAELEDTYKGASTLERVAARIPFLGSLAAQGQSFFSGGKDETIKRIMQNEAAIPQNITYVKSGATASPKEVEIARGASLPTPFNPNPGKVLRDGTKMLRGQAATPSAASLSAEEAAELEALKRELGQ